MKCIKKACVVVVAVVIEFHEIHTTVQQGPFSNYELCRANLSPYSLRVYACGQTKKGSRRQSAPGGLDGPATSQPQPLPKKVTEESGTVKKGEDSQGTAVVLRVVSGSNLPGNLKVGDWNNKEKVYDKVSKERPDMLWLPF